MMNLGIAKQTVKSSCIENLKGLLMSRDFQQQLKAVLIINTCFKNHEHNLIFFQYLVEKFLISDIGVFLCEALETLQPKLLREILKCFYYFSKNPLFYEKSYSPQVVTSITRSIQFIVKENGPEIIINKAVQLLSNLFINAGIYEKSPVISAESKYNILQLFETLCIVIDKNNYEIETKINTCLVLHSVIIKNNREIKITLKTLANATLNIIKCLEQLCSILVDSKYKYTVDNKLDRVFCLLCNIGIDSLYFCNSFHIITVNSKQKNIMESEENYISKIKYTIFQTFFEITLQMKNLESSIILPNCDIFLRFLNEFFHKNYSEEKLLQFMLHLCTNGFLIFFVQLSTNSTTTKKLCLLNLAEIISFLSSNYLPLRTWPGGIKKFKIHLYEGFLQKTNNFKIWSQILIDKSASDANVESFIVYLYFNCLYAKCPENIVTPLLPYLVKFIQNINSRPNACSDAIIKCLFFIFVIAYTGNSDDSIVEGGTLELEKTNETISHLIVHRISEVYTHHPEILLWAYSSYRICETIQFEVLYLWLEKDNNIPKELASIPALWNSLLKLITIDHKLKNIESYAYLLNKCINTHGKNDDSIKLSIFYTLLNAMKYLSIRSGNVQTVLYLIELSVRCFPKKPPLMKIHEMAILLPSLLLLNEKDNLEFQFRFVTQAYCLLKAALKYEDKIVLSNFISSSLFLQYIFNATLNLNAPISTTALHLLSTALYYSSHYNIEFNKYLLLSPSSLVISMRNDNNYEKIYAILQLLYTVFKLEQSKLKSFAVLTNIYPIEKYIIVYESLFFRLEMMCCKDSKNESTYGWKCLTTMLQLSTEKSEHIRLIQVLTTCPWTNKLIHFYLDKRTLDNCPNIFLIFLWNWLKCFKILIEKDKFLLFKNEHIFEIYQNVNIFLSTFLIIGNVLGDLKTLEPFEAERKDTIIGILDIAGEFMQMFNINIKNLKSKQIIDTTII